MNHDKSFVFVFARPTQNWEHTIFHTLLFVGAKNTDSWHARQGDL
jgi:hypothetical protein